MRIIREASELGVREPVCVAIGMFDGVHLGHQKVLGHTVAEAQRLAGRPVAITFDRHPNAVVAPDKAPLLIYSLPQRLRTIASLGLGAALLIRFDRAFSQQPAEAFIRSLAGGFGRLASVCVGEDFTFGYRRSGNIELLRSLGQELGFVVSDLAAVSWDGKTVSSTRVREEIQSGNLQAVGHMLGRPYALAGQVGAGDHLGKTLGFPTANLDVTGLALPPNGVYAGYAHLDSRQHNALVNIGFRPTLGRSHPERRFEVHLLDFEGDLYGAELEFSFRQRLRDEAKFGTLAALREQIKQDITSARALLG